MQQAKRTVSRPLVGILAIGLFSLAFVLSLWPNLLSDAAGAMVGGAATRVGVVMAALWLALPSRNRPAAWVNVRVTSVLPLVLVAMALFRIPFRFLVPLAGLVLLTGVVLRPKPLQRPERRVSE
jgi:hypothetical protein